MSKKTIGSFVALGITSLLLWGTVRAATGRYGQESKAIYAQCQAEQGRLGLTRDKLGDKYWKTLLAKYPTPEITLCPLVRVLPGGTGEVVVQGKFASGTKFLLNNDAVEVVKESVTPSEYRASLKVPAGAGPGVAAIEAVAPVSCADSRCRVVYVGGKYEWDFTANNGWRITLTMLEEGNPGRSGKLSEATYRAEFYRGTEPKPFEVRLVQLPPAAPDEHELGAAASYGGSIGESVAAAAEARAIQAEQEKLTAKLFDPKLSDQEEKRVKARRQEIADQELAKLRLLVDPKYQEARRKEQQEFGCTVISFSLKAGAVVKGRMQCGEKAGGSRGSLELKGTMKYLGP